jgi:hypothetical protein
MPETGLKTGFIESFWLCLFWHQFARSVLRDNLRHRFFVPAENGDEIYQREEQQALF